MAMLIVDAQVHISGTDLTGIPCTYRQAIPLFTEELPWLEGDDLDWVMGRGICEWPGWKLTGDSDSIVTGAYS
jgi:hypothetical protein